MLVDEDNKKVLDVELAEQEKAVKNKKQLQKQNKIHDIKLMWIEQFERVLGDYDKIEEKEKVEEVVEEREKVEGMKIGEKEEKDRREGAFEIKEEEGKSVGDRE